MAFSYGHTCQRNSGSHLCSYPPLQAASLFSSTSISGVTPTSDIELPDGKTQFGKTIINNPEDYFTEEVMKQLDEAAEKEFKYGNIHSEV